MEPPLRSIPIRMRRHFATLAQRPKWAFLLQAWLETTVLAYLTANLIHTVFDLPRRTDLDGLSPVRLVAMAVVIGPLIETVIFQFLPLEIGRSLRWPRILRFVLSIVPFGLAHHRAGLPTMIGAGIVGGFFFAFTYDRWRRESLAVAVLMTVLLHSSFNCLGTIALLLSR